MVSVLLRVVTVTMIQSLALLLLLGSTHFAIAEEDALSRSKPPNFVVVLADDLDWTLGGADASTLARTRRLIGGAHGGSGKTYDNWFVQTPVCCSSRAEMLSGRVFHNLRVPNATSPRGCMHVDVADDPSHPFWRDYYFSNYFANRTNLGLNYKVGIFGKHLNTHNPSHFMPNGVDEMLINGGGEYLNPSFVHGKKKKKKNNATIDKDLYYDEIEVIKFDNCTETTGMPCYSTSVIGNASLAWIRRQVEANNEKETNKDPFFALVSVKAPHIQDGNGFPMATPAPWYKHTMIPEITAPRTPNYNVTNPGHHWIVRTQPPLTALEATKVDELYVSRLKTLISIDDLVEDLVGQLEQLGVLDNTYIIFTSDNGYRLGQFRMPQCKLHPYENDVRVPMMIRGPGITTITKTTSPVLKNNAIDNTKNKAMFSHVHLMPTLLGLATGEHDSQEILPGTMDGTNLARSLLADDEDEKENGFTPTSSSSSSSASSLLIEYSSLGNVIRYQHLIDTFNHSFVALRIMSTDTTRSMNIDPKAVTVTATANSTNTTTIKHISNLKYIEFRDNRDDWTNTQPPLERELYDLDTDPYELDNLLSPMRIAPSLMTALELKTDRLIACKGEDCRKEHSSGLDLELLGVDIQLS